ncbi:MFS transporter [Glaciecola petra]|uniref:MFS transporter n=1 Tax=Glaciecola petra TaxID=3075602 RepID=A0ABU2ZWG4_9ALTE|nr:MFS transporter [Aestuariibacter sp. P117]MDT0596649.1 MFS transporter [Aestuariibacter sp. P117]
MTTTTVPHKHSSRIFLLSCLALVVTAMTFAIRAGIVPELGKEFGLTNVQLGVIIGMAFWGFPAATVIGGFLYNTFGAKKLLWVAFICHTVGLVLTITANGYYGLIVSTFLVGFGNGAVEAACNPLISDMYKDNKTTMLNKFHVWFPGGIVIGALVSYALNTMGFSWEYQIAVMLLPAAVYAAMLIGCEFPELNKEIDTTSGNLQALLRPLFLFFFVVMTITATTELGTQGWISEILAASGATPMLILALITGIMAVGRYFAGPLVHSLNPAGVLLGSSVLAFIGIFLLTQVSGSMVYVAAVFFALGVTYFWPTMLGCVTEYMPKTGALGLSLVGGAGMAGVAIFNPIIGGWADDAKAQAITNGATGTELTMASGQAILSNLMIFPLVLIVLFAGLYFFVKKSGIGKKA